MLHPSILPKYYKFELFQAEIIIGGIRLYDVSLLFKSASLHSVCNNNPFFQGRDREAREPRHRHPSREAHRESCDRRRPAGVPVPPREPWGREERGKGARQGSRRRARRMAWDEGHEVPAGASTVTVCLVWYKNTYKLETEPCHMIIRYFEDIWVPNGLN